MSAGAEDPKAPKTAGIAPAQKGALAVLQFTPNFTAGEGGVDPREIGEVLGAACDEVATYHAPVGDQAQRHKNLSRALSNFLYTMVKNCPPGPERSTAISRAREAKMWASAAVALEGK